MIEAVKFALIFSSSGSAHVIILWISPTLSVSILECMPICSDFTGGIMLVDGGAGTDDGGDPSVGPKREAKSVGCFMVSAIAFNASGTGVWF